MIRGISRLQIAENSLPGYECSLAKTSGGWIHKEGFRKRLIVPGSSDRAAQVDRLVASFAMSNVSCPPSLPIHSAAAFTAEGANR